MEAGIQEEHGFFPLWNKHCTALPSQIFLRKVDKQLDGQTDRQIDEIDKMDQQRLVGQAGSTGHDKNCDKILIQ